MKLPRHAGSYLPFAVLLLSGSHAGWVDSVEFEVEQDFTARERLRKPAIMLVHNLGSSLITWLYDSYQYNQCVCWYVLLWLTVVCVCVFMGIYSSGV